MECEIEALRTSPTRAPELAKLTISSVATALLDPAAKVVTMHADISWALHVPSHGDTQTDSSSEL